MCAHACNKSDDQQEQCGQCHATAAPLGMRGFLEWAAVERAKRQAEPSQDNTRRGEMSGEVPD